MLTTQSQLLANGRTLRVARLGAGPPWLLLHGYPDNLQIWERLARTLAVRFEVFAFDWPGMGYSESWAGGATPQHLAARLLALLDEWNLRQVSLLGMDMGGQPALAFAAAYPERVQRLVVMNSLVYGDEPTSWEIRVLRKFGWNRFVLRRFPSIVFRRALHTFLPPRVHLPRDLRSDLWNAFRQQSVRDFVSKMCAGYQGALPSLPRLYDRVNCPTLVLWAGRDRHFPPRHAERLHQQLSNAKLVIVPEAEHWMAWYRGEEVGREVLAFADQD